MTGHNEESYILHLLKDKVIDLEREEQILLTRRDAYLQDVSKLDKHLVKVQGNIAEVRGEIQRLNPDDQPTADEGTFDPKRCRVKRVVNGRQEQCMLLKHGNEVNHQFTLRQKK